MRASSDAHTCANHSRRAGELSCLRANRTRHNASKSRAQVARPLQNSRCLFCAGFEDTSRCFGKVSAPYTKHCSFNQRIGCIQVTLYRSVQKNCIRRRVRSTCGTHPCFARHRGASTPTPRRRQRSLRCRIPRHNTSGRTTVSQHHLDHGLGPQQGPEARRGHTHQ